MLEDLRACKSLSSLAVLLEVKPSELSYILYKLPDSLKYNKFCISKKRGGTRNILAPCNRLKWIQSRLLDLLYLCEDDIASISGVTRNLHLGFRRDVNIFDNAKIHRKKRHVFNVDIANFFDQFNFGRVRGFFINDRNFVLDPAVATVIAQITCFENVLPQGSPTSPHVANLLTQFFDARMARFLRPRRCAYSRYADDITISTNLKEFPAEVALSAPGDPQGWLVSPELDAIFVRAGLPLNPAKTRMSSYTNRQVVTGLVVNQQPNVAREYYLATRSMCHHLFKTGQASAPEITQSFGNNCPDKAGELANEKPLKPSEILRVVEGRLSHIHNIRERSDQRSIQDKQDSPTQFWTMLQDFYLYKYFFANNRAMILTEGPSDIFYIRSAILNDTTVIAPNLKRFVGGNPEVIPAFFRFNTVAARVIGLTGGSGNIKRFLYLYHKQGHKFTSASKTYPVIIVIDNDTGGSDVISMVNGIYKTQIALSDPTMVHKVTDGLLLVKTPHIGAKIHSCVEDMLPTSARAVALNGKTFSSAKKFDTTKHFGKIALASHVQANAGSVNFSGFQSFVMAIDAAVTA